MPNRKENCRLFNKAAEYLQAKYPGRDITVDEIIDAVGGPGRRVGWPTDFCYNRTNVTTPFNHHLFLRTIPGHFRWLGKQARFDGPISIFYRAQGEKDQWVGEWRNGNWRVGAKFPLSQWISLPPNSHQDC